VILWRRVSSPASAVQAVEHGRGDWIFGLIPRAQYRRLQLTSPAQLHTNPQFDIEFAPVNTHRAPFNDVRVRRALNYAVDRAKIAQMYGGPGFATPACQPLAPGLPGYRRYCPYTKHPRADGAWTAPDLARAQRLVTASGTRAERVDVWGVTDSAYVPSDVPAYFAQVLRSLGYRVQLHLAPYASITWPMRRRFQLSTEGDWLAEYPDASSYLPQFFGCRGGTSNGYYCDRRIDREMRATAVLEQNDPAQAAALWTRIDHQLTDDPGWVPTVNGREVELVSTRVHNYEYNPIWGFIADQAWLR
jgi:peptide/nickel transport system substrate-binding protein